MRFMVRDYQSSDASALCALPLDAQELQYMCPLLTFPPSPERFDQVLSARPAVRVWLDGERVIGLASLYDAEPNASACIGTVGIEAEYRGSGLGEALLADICDVARRRFGARRLSLYCEIANQRGLRFYHRCGLVPVGMKRSVPASGPVRLLLELRVPDVAGVEDVSGVLGVGLARIRAMGRAVRGWGWRRWGAAAGAVLVMAGMMTGAYFAGRQACRPVALPPPDGRVEVASTPTKPGKPPLPPVDRAALMWKIRTLPAQTPPDALWTTTVAAGTAPRGWKKIVIHHTATAGGDPVGIDRNHRVERKWPNGMGYHFLIGNGRGFGDGEIHASQRWREQLQGGHIRGGGLNETSIGIALVGNFEETAPTDAQIAALKGLIAALRARTGLPATAVEGHGGVKGQNTLCPGVNCPVEVFAAHSPPMPMTPPIPAIPVDTARPVTAVALSPVAVGKR